MPLKPGLWLLDLEALFLPPSQHQKVFHFIHRVIPSLVSSETQTKETQNTPHCYENSQISQTQVSLLVFPLA